MKYPAPGHFRTAAEFRDHLRGLDGRFDCALEPAGAAGPLGEPAHLPDGQTIGNRFAIHPMEGWDGERDGAPSVHTLRRWRRFGQSGAKLIWGGEAFAVQEDGRANPNQLFLNPKADTVARLDTLRQEILAGHREAGFDTADLYIGLQLTHSGRFSNPNGQPAPRRVYAHPVLDDAFGVAADAPILTDGELERIAENFVSAASCAREAGFDFVDVKCCHGYLLHELLSARARLGPYGGDLNGRTRLQRRIIDAVRAECPGLELGVRLSVTDCYPFSANPESGVGEARSLAAQVPYTHGFGVSEDNPTEPEFTEPFEFLRQLREIGVQLLNITIGSPYYCPHIQRPAAYPPSDGYLPPEDPLLGALRHLTAVRACKAAFPEFLIVGSGYSYLQEWLGHVAEHEVGAGHVNFVGIGRMALSYPEFPADILRNSALKRRRICRTFSDCTTAPRNGLISGCYPLDPYYKNSPEGTRLKAVKKRVYSTRKA